MAIVRGPTPGPIAFTGSPIERADMIRVNPEALASHMNWRARVMNLDGMLPEFDDDGRLLWHTLADVGPDAGDAGTDPPIDAPSSSDDSGCSSAGGAAAMFALFAVLGFRRRDK